MNKLLARLKTSVSSAPFNPSRRAVITGALSVVALLTIAGFPFDARAATTYFVSSVDGNNADDGLSWANAKATVAGALAVPVVAGDIILVDSAHNFTATAAITWTPPAGGVAIISVNRAGSDAPLAGAAESVGAASISFTIANVVGSAMYVFGMTINGGTTASASCVINVLNSVSAQSLGTFESCTFDIKAAAGAFIAFGSSGQSGSRSLQIQCINCTFIRSGSNTTNFLNVGESLVDLVNPTISCTGASKPATLVASANLADRGSIIIRDADLSGYSVSSGAYVSVTNMTMLQVLIKNCKLHATPTLTTGTWPGGEGSITVRNTDSGDTINVFKYYNAYGTLEQDTAVTLSGGTAFNGTAISWKIITTAAATQFEPFVTPILPIWNTLTTAQTAEIEIIRDSGTNLTNQDIWSTINFAASASFPNYTYQTNRNAAPITGTPADQPSSAATWNGAGGWSNPNKQKLQHAFTAAEVGRLEARIRVGLASATIYVNPKINGVS